MNTAFNNLHLEIVQGDDCRAVDGRAITFVGHGVQWPAAAQVKFNVYEPDDNRCDPLQAITPVLTSDGVYAPLTNASPPTASFDVLRSQSVQLATGVRRYVYEVRALLPSGSVITLARGHVTVLESQL